MPSTNRDPLNSLRTLGPPQPKLLGSAVPIPTAESLREGRFRVFGQEALLAPPIDWHQDPHGSRSWCYHLHSLTWLTPALHEHARSGDEAPLAVALGVIVDWISSHPADSGEVSELAWNDMAVSQRAPTLAYALRAGLAADLLETSNAELLLGACERHGAELANDDNYSAGHNHGLAQDEALYLLASQLPALPTADEWSRRALKRMRSTLEQTISEREGVHLEHSSSYQFAIARMVSRLAATVTEWPELQRLGERLHRTAAWHVTPLGRVAHLGDSDDDPAPQPAILEASHQRGMETFCEAGNVFVRERESYLAFSAAYHSAAHKHADDTGFLLIECGRTVLGDAGRWGYYEDEPDRRYARSAHAHNVLTVDGEDFEWHRCDPYGSGLLATAERDGWYAVLAANPLLASQGVTHRRLLLYRPAEALVIVDEVKADESHRYTRRFHFGPELEAHLAGVDRIAIVGRGFLATLVDLSQSSEIELSRGQDQPTRSGWTYPRDRERLPIDTASLSCEASDATLAAALTLGRSDLVVQRATLDDQRALMHTNRGEIEVRMDADRKRAEIHLSG